MRLMSCTCTVATNFQGAKAQGSGKQTNEANEDTKIDNEDTGSDNGGNYRAITEFSEDTGEYQRPNRKVQALARKHNKIKRSWHGLC